jgi:hypothetical protein
VEDQAYRNVFAEVHSKIKALKERTAAANKDDREAREGKAAEESQKQSGVDFSQRDR